MQDKDDKRYEKAGSTMRIKRPDRRPIKPPCDSRYFVFLGGSTGVKSNFCPPTVASAISPVCTIVKMATPGDGVPVQAWFVRSTGAGSAIREAPVAGKVLDITRGDGYASSTERQI